MLLLWTKAVAPLAFLFLTSSNAQQLTQNDSLQVDPGVQCDEVITRRSWPVTKDCASAIQNMPQTVEARTFTRSDGPRPEDRLPKSFSFGRCRVTINLQDRVVEENNRWFLLGLAADRLVYGCSTYVPAHEYMRTRGQMAVGRFNILVEKIGVGDDEDEEEVANTY